MDLSPGGVRVPTRWDGGTMDRLMASASAAGGALAPDFVARTRPAGTVPSGGSPRKSRPNSRALKVCWSLPRCHRNPPHSRTGEAISPGPPMLWQRPHPSVPCRWRHLWRRGNWLYRPGRRGGRLLRSRRWGIRKARHRPERHQIPGGPGYVQHSGLVLRQRLAGNV